ncbi:helix-turn-helix transcriptional regulator [Chitinophaga barathri]|uniref:XRE family transcriptional regulator n=1 Tax=Chitinophaga barathri TaxID=1647451 RepID=A0A3N4MT41_9BACT|nr:helix-turn-helix transcriptional regulator [Chitinophaga barathri]RPD38583.1 XRE family transcriptional regulator [Chitinophaga barathri]
MRDTIGKKFFYIRMLHGYTQEYVAKKIGVSISSYIDLEAGRIRKVPIGRVQDILALYGLTMENFFSFKPEDLMGLIKGETETIDEKSMREMVNKIEGMYQLLFQLVDKFIRPPGWESRL